MIVYNKTQITKERAEKILTKSARVQNFQHYTISLIFLLAGACLLIVSLASKANDLSAVSYMLLAFGVVFLIYAIVQTVLIPKKIKNTNVDILTYGASYDYKLKEQSIELTVNENGKLTKKKYTFKDDIKKIYEFDDTYELRTNDQFTMFIDKSGFESKRMEEFFVKNVKSNKKKIKNKTTKNKEAK